METMTPYRGSVQTGRDGLVQLLRAEWTKLRSVPRWILTMIAAVVLTILFAMIVAVGTNAQTAGGGGGDGPAAPRGFTDHAAYVHRPISGDVTVIARVTAQDATDAWAKAGLMIRETTVPGSPHAALMTTPGHGVHLQSNFTTDVAGSGSTAPRWLKLTRTGTSVTGYESADGVSWSEVGTVELDGLGSQVEVGVFVASPDAVTVERRFGGESISGHPNPDNATFADVAVEPEQTQELAPWDGGEQSVDPDATTFTVRGTGDIGVDPFPEDRAERTLSAVMVGLVAIVTLAVLVMTSEYQRGLIRTTFIATPRRGLALAAKAIVLAAATFVIGLVASFGAYTIGPLIQSGGPRTEPLSDPQVLRAVIGTAAMLAVVAVFSLGVAALVRRSAAAITIVLLLLLVPQIVATGLPLSAAMWLQRLTPTAGFAIQQTVERYDTAIGPWAGFGVLCGYAAVALGFAIWRVRRQDA